MINATTYRIQYSMANLSPNQERALRDTFDRFDRDHSGQLSRKELRNVLKALQITSDDTDLQAQIDFNGNGEIDFDEFKAMMINFYSRQHTRETLEAAFKKFDSDGNGFLSVDEIQCVMSKMGRHMSRSEVKSMVQSLDLNKDGKISFEEFIKWLH